MTTKQDNTLTLWEQISASEDPNIKSAYQSFLDYNKTLANSLTILDEQPQDIQDREAEMKRLVRILERPLTRVALLLGEAGSGKTALCEAFQKEINRGTMKIGIPREYLMFSLDLGMLSALDNSKKQAALANLMPTLSLFEQLFAQVLDKPHLRLVVFADEIHMLVTIFGEGTKVGGDVMKRVLARPPIRFIGATTRREFDSTIAVDKPLAQRFKQIELSQVSDTTVHKILKNWWINVCGPEHLPTDDDLEFIIQANKNYRSDSAEPRRSMDILEDLAAITILESRDVTRKDITDAFFERYSVSTALNVDPDEAFNQISSKVFGQPHAMKTMKKVLRSLSFQLEEVTNQPRLRVLMVGATGTGKTATVKAFAEAIYPSRGEDAIFFMNMPDYKTKESEARMRKDLGEALAHDPGAIVLMDELEKAHEDCLDSLLYILQEGRVNYEVTNREGRAETDHSSLRNCFIFATSNAGDKIFQVDGKYNQRSVESDSKEEILDVEMESLENRVIEDLKESAGFKNELIGRFPRIFMYRALDEETLLKIAQTNLEKLSRRFEVRGGYQIRYNEPQTFETIDSPYVTTDAALFVTFAKANASDASSGGARAIEKAVDVYVTDLIVDSIIDHPDHKEFLVTASENSFVYTEGATYSEGGVIVEPISPDASV